MSIKPHFNFTSLSISDNLLTNLSKGLLYANPALRTLIFSLSPRYST